MSFLDIFKTKATTWTYGNITQDNKNGLDLSSREIVAGQEYIKIVLKSMRIVYKGRGFGKYYPVVHSYCSLGHLSSKKAEFSYITTPPKLAELDQENLDRVVQINQVVLGPIPFRGGDVDVEIGLFSIKSVDLAKPVIDLVKKVADKSGVRFINAVLPYTEIVEEGLKVLTGSKDTILEIGLSTTYNPLKSGYYAVIAAPKGSVDLEKIRIDVKDFSLLSAAGKLLADYPYLVFQIIASKQREDWYEIPEVSSAYNKLQADLKEGNRDNVKLSLEVFARIVNTSPDLTDVDGARLVEEVGQRVKLKLKATTIKSNSQPELEDLKSIPLYN